MRFLIIGNFTTGWDGSICDEKHIASSLRGFKHDVVEYQREEFNSENLPPEQEFDVVLLAQWNGYPQNVCRMLKDFYKCMVVYWAFDYQYDSNEYWHMEMAKESDLFLSKEMNNRQFYEKMGSKFKWLPQDFSPESNTSIEPFVDMSDISYDDFIKREEESEWDVVFTGTYLPEAKFRTDLLKAIDEKYKLAVYSVNHGEWTNQGLKNVFPPIVDDSAPYREAKIVLSVDWKVDAEGYWSDRLAQVMCYGKFVINKYIPMQELVFPDETKHFNTIEECLKLIEDYVQLPQERYENARDCYEFAQKNLKVDNRVKDLLQIIEYEISTI